MTIQESTIIIDWKNNCKKVKSKKNLNNLKNKMALPIQMLGRRKMTTCSTGQKAIQMILMPIS